MTALKLVDALMGKRAGNLKLADWKKPPKEIAQKSQIEHIVATLLIEGRLREDFHFTPYNTISYILPGRASVLKPMIRKVPSDSKKTDFSNQSAPRTNTEKMPRTKKPKLDRDVVYIESDSEWKLFDDFLYLLNIKLTTLTVIRSRMSS